MGKMHAAEQREMNTNAIRTISSNMRQSAAFILRWALMFMFLISCVNGRNAYAAITLQQAAENIEHSLHARVGFYVLDTGNGKQWQYRANERFLLTSTFKVLACGDLLHQQEKGQLFLTQEVTLHAANILDYAPVTRQYIERSMSYGQLCQAAIQYSDNTAGNLILQRLGGPQALTQYVRTLGDTTTRLDRNEPSLNVGAVGDVRDTTTPKAMALTLDHLLLGGALGHDSSLQLLSWMQGNKVTGTLLRAGLPSNWKIADKSGSGSDGSRAVIAVIWPPHHAPLVVTLYMRGSKAPLKQLDAAIAQWARNLAILFI